jgi:hypothetical protein
MSQQHNGVYYESSLIHTLSREIWDVTLGYVRRPPDMNSLEDLHTHGRFVKDRTLNDGESTSSRRSQCRIRIITLSSATWSYFNALLLFS